MTDLARAYQCIHDSCQDGVISRTAALKCGLTDADIKRLVRRGRWTRLFNGTFLIDVDQPEISRTAWLRAALVAHGPAACLVGPTAAEVLGFQGVPSQDVIWIGLLPVMSRQARSSSIRRHQRIRAQVRQLPLTVEETTLVRGLRVTRPFRTLMDTVLGLNRACALSVLDSAINLGHVTAIEVQELAATGRGRPGVQRLREVLPLVDGRAQSPLETRVRLTCIDGGVPPDELQYPVRDARGVLLGFADLAWFRGLRRPLVVECDGVGPHSLPNALFRDRYRANDFTLADVDILRFTWPDAGRLHYISGVVRRALARSAA